MPRIIVGSFDLSVLPPVGRLLPEVRLAALFQPSVLRMVRKQRQVIEMAQNFGAREISLHHTLITSRMAALAAAAALPVTVWTCDQPRWVRRCKTLGIGSLITNDPELMLQELDALRSLEEAS